MTTKTPSDYLSGNPLKQKAIVIKGRIIDKSGNLPLSGATVYWLANSKTKNYISQSDLNGEFMLVIRDSLIGKRMKIQVGAVGFAQKSIMLKRTQLPINDLRIVVEPFAIHDYF